MVCGSALDVLEFGMTPGFSGNLFAGVLGGYFRGSGATGWVV